MKKIGLFAVLVSLLTFSFTVPVQAALSNGTPCKVEGKIEGQFSTAQKTDFLFYSCTKVKSKLVWTEIKYSKSAYAPNGSNYKKLIASRASVIYPGQGKKCVVGDCAIGSVGPAGGIVFYDAGSLKSWGRYLEVAPIGWTGRGNEDITSTWCNPDNIEGDLKSLGNVNSDSKILPFTGQSIGLGKVQTSKMLDKCPLGAALPITNYLGGNTSDWYLPSVDELNELCKFAYGIVGTTNDVRCDSVGNPRLGFSKDLYWSSSQANAKGFPMPAAYGNWFGPTKAFPATAAVDAIPNPRAIRPIRAFGSPADKLADAGIIQPAGVGESSWPVKCPVVIDTQKSAQPQVTAINFKSSDSHFSRLRDNSSSAVTEPSNLIGCYADIGDLENGGSFYSIGSINRDKNGYFWQNGGGDTVGGRIRLELSGSALIATTGDPETISFIK
jgi:hypothetical protein